MTVSRAIYAVPPAVHYSLTPLGESLTQPLDALRDWAELHMGQIDDTRARADEPAG